MAKRAARESTLAYLHSHGIRVTPQALDALVIEAVGRLHRILQRPDPRADLTVPEVEALEAGGFVLDGPELGVEDPLVRTTAEYTALLKSSLSTTEAAARLGVDPSRIRQRLTSDPPTLYGIRLESGWVIPELQFGGPKLIPGLGEVVAALDPELHPVTIFRWFTQSNPDLVTEHLDGQVFSPREWLMLGLPPRTVAELAANL